MRYRFIFILSAACVLFLFGNHVTAGEIDPGVFRVMLNGCGLKGKGFVQTGFRARWNGHEGIVTALHGVAGCNRYYATQGKDTYLSDLKFTAADVDRDIAFLSSGQLGTVPGTALPKTNYDLVKDDLKVVGYPDGVLSQVSNKLRYHENPLRKLGSWHQSVRTMCEQRKSPRCDIDILLVAKEPLLPGDSGAPVFNQQNQVVGIADGGVKGGFALLNWIIPYTDVHLLPVSQFTVFLDFLRQQDLTKLFAQASTLGEDRFPHGHETVITGKVLYGGYYSVPLGVAADYTPADAVIQLWDTETRKEVPVDFTYDHHTGQYSITNVPVGKFSISIRLEAGYPFYKVSGGDFISYLSGLNDNIIVAPYDDQIYRDLKVVKSIHLTRPVNNQEERTFTSDPPEILYKENYYPSASVFKWDPVPGADRYEVTILLHDEATNKNTDIKTISTSQSKLYPALDVNHGHTCYWFSVKALNGNGDMIGYFANYYKNGFGGWFKFKVLEKPYQL